MRVCLVNSVHLSIGSRVPGELLPPLGLQAIGGPLLDAGHDVALINGDLDPGPDQAIVDRVLAQAPQVVMIGHSGSTSAHPTVVSYARLLKQRAPDVTIIYGGVYPTYHWQDVLEQCRDIIVRGEGEATCLALIDGLETGAPMQSIPGIAYRSEHGPRTTRPAPMIKDLDAHRTGWELVDLERHSYWGGRKAVVMQFSRGCPHLCTYCGQRGFWTQWRSRDPVKFAAEIAWLVREHGVELVNLADENPTSSRRRWKAFLEALIAENVQVTLIGSTRADDIVRDADLLPLYKQAGCLRFLLGLEGTDEATLATLKKGGTRSKDRQAIDLLRQHDMIGLCTFAVGFAEETDADYLRLMRQLLHYDPDRVMSIYATPHRWTPFFGDAAGREVIQPDLRRWDYKHQVMRVPGVAAWRVFLWVKVIELVLQLRPRALWRNWLHPDPEIRHAMRWYTRMGRGVILSELADFLWRAPRKRMGHVAGFLGGSDQLGENALDSGRRKASVSTTQDIAQDLL